MFAELLKIERFKTEAVIKDPFRIIYSFSERGLFYGIWRIFYLTTGWHFSIYQW